MNHPHIADLVSLRWDITLFLTAHVSSVQNRSLISCAFEIQVKLFPECKFFSMYGLTECKRVSILLPSQLKEKYLSVGRPIPNTECFVVDERGEKLPVGKVGELIVKGPHVMIGYWNDPELTKKTFGYYGVHPEKMLRTGDICKIDDERFIYFIGRNDDLFKQNGYRVSTAEIEIAAQKVIGVNLACAIYDAELEQSLLFFSGSIEEEELKIRLKALLEEYKLPKKIIKVNQFPFTPNGKINRNKLINLSRGETA